MRMRPVLRISAAAALPIAIAAACDSTPTRPSIVPLPQPPSVTVSRIEIAGPPSVPPGQTAMYTATAHHSDGTTADVTRDATWRSSQPQVLTVVNGLVTAIAPGEATLQAIFRASAARVIMVLPDGTYRVVGTVREADSPPVPIAGVRVETSAGGAGPSAVSGLDGRYRLYGVSGAGEIRAGKEGYLPVVQPLALTDHATVDLSLPLAAPRSNLAGTYELTIDAAADCRDRLPAEARTRRYTAAVTQQGAVLEVRLSGADFVVDPQGHGNGFSGRLEPGQAVFTVDGWDYYYYRQIADVTERLGDALYYAVSGTVTASAAPGRIAGTLTGELATMTVDPLTFPAPATRCRSTAHAFVLSR